MVAVSVVIPAFNRRGTIERALWSVADQTFRDLEVIVCDDCSTDDTARIVEELSDTLPCEIRLERLHRNLGAGAARNWAVSRSNGHYIAFLDSDDRWLPDKLMKQLDFLERNPGYIGVGCNGFATTDSGKVLGSFRDQDFRHSEKDEIVQILTRCYIFTSALVVRKDMILLSGLFDISLRKGQDRDLFFRLPSLGHVGFLNEELFEYRVHGDSISTQLAIQTGQTYLLSVRKAVWFWRDQLSKAESRRIIANAHMISAVDAATVGGVRQSIAHSVQAILHGADFYLGLRNVLIAIRNGLKRGRR